jgi:hypothetical protein
VLSPEPENFAPTVFYDKEGNVSYVHHYTKKGFILDTTVMHSMKNNEHKRYMLQLCYSRLANDLVKNILK